jgi:hypothetical protein
MFTGDNVLGHGTSPVEELGLYMEMLRTLQSHNCAVGYPAHGDVIPNLPAKIAGELAQKTRRERQVLMTLDRLNKEMTYRSRQKGKRRSKGTGGLDTRGRNRRGSSQDGAGTVYR